jgi:hypothetical protein
MEDLKKLLESGKFLETKTLILSDSQFSDWIQNKVIKSLDASDGIPFQNLGKRIIEVNASEPPKEELNPKSWIKIISEIKNTLIEAYADTFSKANQGSKSN